MEENNSRTPGRPRSKKSHEAILDAARKLALQSGYANVTLQQIADAAGASRQTIYRWWHCKADLFLELIQEEYSNLAHHFPAAEENSLENYFTGVFHTGPLLWDIALGLMGDSLHDERFEKLYRQFIAERRKYIHDILYATAKRRQARFSLPLDVITDMVIGTMWYRMIYENLPLNKALAHNLSKAVDALLIPKTKA